MQAAFEPLVAPELFDRTQLVLAGKGHVSSKHDHQNSSFPLRGIVTCAKCDTTLTASFSTGRTKRYPYYRCTKCSRFSIPKARMEKDFIALLDGITEETDRHMAFFRKRVMAHWNDRHAEINAQQDEQKRLLKKLERQQERLLDKLRDGTIDDDTYR